MQNQTQANIYKSQIIRGTVTSRINSQTTRTNKKVYCFKVQGSVSGPGEDGMPCAIAVKNLTVMAFDEAALVAEGLLEGDKVSFAGHLIPKPQYTFPAFAADYIAA